VKGRFDFGTNRSQGLTRSLDCDARLAIKGQAFLVQSSELLRIGSQRPFYAIGKAPLPKFGNGCVQENRWPRTKQFAVPFLYKSAATESDHAIVLRRLGEQIAKGTGFGKAKTRLTSFPKNLRNGLPLTGFDSGIQIHEIPVQAPGKLLPNAALTGSHESHKKHCAHSHGAPWNDTLGPHESLSEG
jgi:hypothetical protein